MSSTESATARLVSGVGRTFEGGALTAFVAQRVETSTAITTSTQLSRSNFFMRGSFLTSLSFKTLVPIRTSSLCNLCVLCDSVVVYRSKLHQRYREHRGCTEKSNQGITLNGLTRKISGERSRMITY